jgi:hypothetical protein
LQRRYVGGRDGLEEGAGKVGVLEIPLALALPVTVATGVVGGGGGSHGE